MACETNNIPAPDTKMDLIAQTPDLNSGSFLNSTSQTIWLPSPDYWLRSPSDPIKTPINELGLIDTDLLIAAVKKTIDPAFDWSSKDSTHHFYWPASNYLHETSWRSGHHIFNEASFRELTMHKGELPRVFENWLHVITRPPDKPDQEVMQHILEGYYAARGLFNSIRMAIKWTRRSDRWLEQVDETKISNDASIDCLADIIDRHFRGVERSREELA